MNRHIKKVNSIFFYQKKYTDKVIKNINDISNCKNKISKDAETKLNIFKQIVKIL